MNRNSLKDTLGDRLNTPFAAKMHFRNLFKLVKALSYFLLTNSFTWLSKKKIPRILRLLFLQHRLIQSAFGSFCLKIANSLLSLVLSVMLARILGVTKFGIFSLYLSIVGLLTVPSLLGAENILVREISIYRASGNFYCIKELLINSRRASLFFSFFLIFIVATIAAFLYPDRSKLVPFLMALIIVPLQTCIRLNSAVLRGLGHVLQGQLALTFRPFILIVLVCLTYILYNRNMDLQIVLFLFIFSVIIMVTCTYMQIRRKLDLGPRSARTEFDKSRWIKSILPFVFLSIMQILNAEFSVLLLGTLQGATAVGIYRVAQHGSEIIPFCLIAVNMAIAPTVSELFFRDDKKRLQELIDKSVLFMLSFALPVMFFLIISGKWFISSLFGFEYISAYYPMIILILGQLVNVGMGSVGLLLNMAGLERITAIGVTISSIICLILNTVLIPFWGPLGAALATSGSLIIMNISLSVWLHRETGILSTFCYRKINKSNTP